MTPYTHTLTYDSALTGSPLVRPLFYEFPEERNVGNNYNQFMLGDSLLVSPVLEYTQENRFEAFFPYGSW